MKISFATRGCIAASAMAIAVGGLFVSPAPPAQAAKCLQHGFSVGEVRFPSTDNNELKFFTNGGANASGPGELRMPDSTVQGNIVGGISGTRLDVTFTWGDNLRRQYVGTVGADGVARGTVSNPSVNFVATAITCLQEDTPPPVQEAPPVEVKPVEVKPVETPPAPLEGPTVTSQPGLLGVTFAVTDRSGVTSQCTYSSEGVEKSFELPANGKANVFVPAIRLFTERTGTVTCDNGTSTDTSVFF